MECFPRRVNQCASTISLEAAGHPFDVAMRLQAGSRNGCEPPPVCRCNGTRAGDRVHHDCTAWQTYLVNRSDTVFRRSGRLVEQHTRCE